MAAALAAALASAPAVAQSIETVADVPPPAGDQTAQVAAAADSPVTEVAATADGPGAEVAAAGSDDGIDTLFVTARPIRDSLEQSLEAQREAPNVVNVVASDTIGRFPDATAAAALARLPGIAVQRDQGQERYIQLRGAPAQWTSVAFDGINILGAEDRIFRFDSVPAAQVDSIVVNKTLTPDMPAEALAGRVDIQTYSPLEHPGWQLQADGGYGFVDLGNGPQEQYSARLSWGGEQIGVMLAASHTQFEQQTDNAEPRYDAQGRVTEVRNAKYIIERETNSTSAKFEYALAEQHKLHLTTLYTEFLDHEQRNQYTFRLSRAADLSGYTPGEGDLVGVPVVGAFEKGEYKISTAATILGGDHQLAEWYGEWRLAYTKTEDETRLPIINQLQTDVTQRPSIHYTTGQYGLPVLELYDTVMTEAGPARGQRSRALRQDAFGDETLTLYNLGSESEAWTLKSDWQRDWHLFGPSQLKLGLQYDDRESNSPAQQAFGTQSLRAAAAAAGVPWTPSDFITGTPVDQDFNRGYTFNYINNAGMRGQLYTLLDALAANNVPGFPAAAANPASAYTVTEDIAAVYAMNSWSFGRQHVMAGVRVEHVSISSEGSLVLGTQVQPVSLDNSYTNVFPSVHWNVDLSDDLKLRIAGISGVARPNFEQLRANATINDSSQTVNGGNPELDPESAYGADISLEWYFGPGAVLSASGFHREVEDVLFDSTTAVGNGRYDFGGIARDSYEYSTTFNGDSGQLSGAELVYTQPFDFLPEAFSGFGFSGSVAFIDGSFTTPDGREVSFPGTSDRVINASIFYENHGVSLRLGYQHRTDWLDDVSSDAAGDIYWDATERVDLSGRLQVSQHVTLFFDAVNLSDEVGVRYIGNESRPYEVEGFGRRFLAGIRVNFGDKRK